MKVVTAKTTIDLTGDEIREMISAKVSEALGKRVALSDSDIAITYSYEKKADGKGYKKTESIKRVRVTL